MKRKQLTIFFFSIMTLAATPQAMNQFNSYTSALHNHAEARWLQFLLSFGSPVESQSETVRQPEAAIVTCTLPATEVRQKQKSISRDPAKRSTRSASAQNALNEGLRNMNTYALENIKNKASEFQFDAKALENVLHNIPRTSDGLANEQTRAMFIKSLIRSNRVGGKKTQRLLDKERRTAGREKAGAIPYVRARLEKNDGVQFETVKNQTLAETPVEPYSVEDSMH